MKEGRFEFPNGGWVANDEACPNYEDIIDYDDTGYGYGSNANYTISYENMHVIDSTKWKTEFRINRGNDTHQRVVKLVYSSADYLPGSTTIKKLDIIFTPEANNSKLFSLPSFEIVDSEWPLEYMNITIQLIKITKEPDTEGTETEGTETVEIIEQISKAVGRYKIENVFFDYIGDSESTYIIRLLLDEGENSDVTNQNTLAIRNLQYVLSPDVPVLNNSLPYADYFADTISESHINTLSNICGCLLPTELMNTIRYELFQDDSIKWGQYCWLDQCVDSDFLNTFMMEQIEAIPCPLELNVQNCNISSSITIGSEGDLNANLGTVSQECNSLIDTSDGGNTGSGSGGGDTGSGSGGGDTGSGSGGGDTGSGSGGVTGGNTDNNSVADIIKEFINEPKNLPILISVGGALLILIIVIAVTGSKKRIRKMQQMQQMQMMQHPSNYMWR